MSPEHPSQQAVSAEEEMEVSGGRLVLVQVQVLAPAPAPELVGVVVSIRVLVAFQTRALARAVVQR